MRCTSYPPINPRGEMRDAPIDHPWRHHNASPGEQDGSGSDHPTKMARRGVTFAINVEPHPTRFFPCRQPSGLSNGTALASHPSDDGNHLTPLRLSCPPSLTAQGWPRESCGAEQGAASWQRWHTRDPRRHPTLPGAHRELGHRPELGHHRALWGPARHAPRLLRRLCRRRRGRGPPLQRPRRATTRAGLQAGARGLWGGGLVLRSLLHSSKVCIQRNTQVHQLQ
jgi:hypothetical protein